MPRSGLFSLLLFALCWSDDQASNDYDGEILMGWRSNYGRGRAEFGVASESDTTVQSDSPVAQGSAWDINLSSFDDPVIPSLRAAVASYSLDSKLVVAFSNFGYHEFAVNVAITLKNANVTNFMIVSLDTLTHSHLQTLNIPSFYDATLALDSSAFYHSSPMFQRLMRLRLFVLHQILSSGVDVLFTDADAVFNADPFPLFRDEKHVEFGYDTPYLPTGEDSPLMVMAGFFMMKNCRRFPLNCKLLRSTLAYSLANPDKHDQYAMNQVLSEMPDVDYGVLDPLRFPNGALFFSHRAPQMMDVGAVVVQNNWVISVVNKRHRFREFMLWHVDPPAYFNPPAPLNRYLIYDNLQEPLMGLFYEREALVNALAISRILKRTLVLPLFCLYLSLPGIYEGSADWCTVEEFFTLDTGEHSQSSGVTLHVREHSLPYNPRTPRPTADAFQSAPYLGIKTKHPYIQVSKQSLDDTFVPTGPNGATETEITRWFGTGSEFVDEPVLHFSNLLGAFDQFDQKREQARFEEDVSRSLTFRDEITRHANDISTSFDGPYHCVHLFGGNTGWSQHISTLISLVSSLIPLDQALYVAVDDLTPEGLHTFKQLWHKAFAFELFPWIRQGFRRHQHYLGIHHLVCMNATTVIAEQGSPPSTHLCQQRACVDLLGKSWPS